MATCDICNSQITWEQGTTYTATEFRQLVSRGFEPGESAIAMMMLYGMSRQQAINQWKQGLVAQSTTDWLLCPACAARASMYTPKYPPSRTAKPDVSDLVWAILCLVSSCVFPVFAGIPAIIVARKVENRAAKVLAWIAISLNIVGVLIILTYAIRSILLQ